MAIAQTTGLIPGLVFVGTVAAVLVALFWSRDSRVDAILESAHSGDTVKVGTDVCEVLRKRGLVDAATNCGYRRSVQVRLIRNPK